MLAGNLVCSADKLDRLKGFTYQRDMPMAVKI